MKVKKNEKNTIQLSPSIIYFTHSKIRHQFSGCSKLIMETMEELLESKTKIDQIPYITVYWDGSCYYSFNNRRLWMWKELEKKGFLSLITCVVSMDPKCVRKGNQYSLHAKLVYK